jgi:acyl transferase domain-containing protein
MMLFEWLIAAGMAGLIKIALTLYTRTIPPILHFRECNHNINQAKLKVSFVDKVRKWPV